MTKLFSIAILISLMGCKAGVKGEGSSFLQSIRRLIPSSLSGDQELYNEIVKSGGYFALSYHLPGSDNASPENNYFAAIEESAASTECYQLVSGEQVWQSLGGANAKAVVAPKQYFVSDGKLVPSALREFKLSCQGASLRKDFYSDDGSTLLKSLTIDHLSLKPLNGNLAASADELLAQYPLKAWSQAGYTLANALWLPGSAYIKQHESYAKDSIAVSDCSMQEAGLPSPVPCAVKRLEDFFPYVWTHADGSFRSSYQLADGDITTYKTGMRIWIAKQAIDGRGSQFSCFVEREGAIYFAILSKAGAEDLIQQTDGTAVAYRILLNKTALTSLTQAFIPASIRGTAIASDVGAAALDLFGLGGHGLNGALGAIDLNQLYNLPQDISGKGQVLALIAALGPVDILSDLNVMSQFYGLSSMSPCVANQHPCLQLQTTLKNAETSEVIDAALALEILHAMAPGADIILIEPEDKTPSGITKAIETASALPGVVSVTVAVGSSEAQEASLKAVVQKFPQLAFFATKSGDFPITQTPINAHPAPFAIYLQGRWAFVGGVSLAPPIWAGIVAILAEGFSKQNRSLAAAIQKAGQDGGGFSTLLESAKAASGDVTHLLKYLLSLP